MPKRKRSYKKARRRTRRRISRYSRVSKPAVRSMIRRALRPHKRVIRLVNSRIKAGLNSVLSYYNLSLINTATPVFHTQPEDVAPRIAKHVKMNLDCLVETGTENEGVAITCYVVSAKNNTPDDFFDGASGGLVWGSAGTSYQTVEGQAFINPEYFNIHLRKTIFFPPHPPGYTAESKLSRRFTFSFRPNKIIRNNTGSFEDLICPQKPSDNYWLVFFNNNSSADLEFPYATFNCLNTYVS